MQTANLVLCLVQQSWMAAIDPLLVGWGHRAERGARETEPGIHTMPSAPCSASWLVAGSLLRAEEDPSGRGPLQTAVTRLVVIFFSHLSIHLDLSMPSALTTQDLIRAHLGPDQPPD